MKLTLPNTYYAFQTGDGCFTFFNSLCLGSGSWVQIQDLPLTGWKTLNKPLCCSGRSCFVCHWGCKYASLSETCVQLIGVYWKAFLKGKWESISNVSLLASQVMDLPRRRWPTLISWSIIFGLISASFCCCCVILLVRTPALQSHRPGVEPCSSICILPVLGQASVSSAAKWDH